LRHGTLKDAGTPLPAVAGFQTFGRGRISAFANTIKRQRYGEHSEKQRTPGSESKFC
jgi:hypothetical protein